MKDFAKSIVCNSTVGNKSNYRYKGFLITFSQDGIHVFLQDGLHLAFGPTGSEEKAKDWCDWHDPKTNKPVAQFRNSKVGNAKDRDGKELKVGDVVAVKTSDPRLNHGKIVRISGDQISVDVTGDDDIWTTPARLAVKMGNAIPDSQINGPSAAEVREIAGRVYKTDMRGEDLARAVSFELAKKYKSFQTNSHIMDMVKEVLSKFKTGNKMIGNLDPRIASLKAKIKQAPYKDDKGTLKDVYSLADSTVKDLEGRKRQLLDEVHKIEADLDGWLDLRSELKFMI